MPFSFLKKSKQKEVIDPAIYLKAIDFKGGTLYAENATNKVYVDIEELGGFFYLKTIIIGDLSVKIKRVGCTLDLQFKKEVIRLDSDDTKVESNAIKKTPIFYTEIDFELEKEHAEKMKNGKVRSLTYTFKNQTLTFKRN